MNQSDSALFWDTFIRHHPRGHALQLSAWAQLKQAYGWHADRVVQEEGRQIVAGAQLLFRPLPLRLGTMAYLPFGPFVSDAAQWPALWQAIHTCARRQGAAFLKWEPGYYPPGTPPDPTQWGFRPSPQTIQPPNTIWIDIADDETMLARMNQGTRRKIRQSLKNDVRYYEGQASDVSAFTAMMHTTGARNAFGVHEPAYYQLAHELFVPQDAALMLAEAGGTALAGVMVFAVGAQAWYLYGASSNEHRQLMASYGVQWRAIQWARERGCVAYDMWGIPDAAPDALEAHFQERDDGLWGVYGFKRGWGGRIQRSLGAWDYVYNPLIYRAYRLALRWRRPTEG